MQTSKTLLTVLLSLNVLSLAACNLPSPKEKEASAQTAGASDNSEAATFNVEAAPSRSSVLEATKEGSFALPTSKVFNLYACLKDIYYNKVISGHKFKIDETGKEVTTDASGCLIWSEKISYNFLADSQYIKIDRHIRGTGIHKGVRTVSYAINPWSHGESLAPVMDVKNEDAIPNLVKSQKASSLALKGFSADEKQRTRSLWLEDGRLFVTEQKLTSAGVDLLVEVRGTPSIQLTKMNGEVFLRPLTAGSFKARVKLIHSYVEAGKEIHRLLAQTAVLDAKMENGSLAIRAPIALSAIPTRGQMVLGIQLSPENGPEGLTAFDGIYILGDYDQIKGSSFLKVASQVAQEQNFKIDTYINAQMAEVTGHAGDKQAGAATAHNDNLDQDVYQKPKMEVAQLEFKNIRVGSETTSTREVIYNVKACLRNGIDQKSARAQTFKVTKFRQNGAESSDVLSVKTDNNSCVNWDENIKVKYFDCQRYLKGSVTIENADLGMSEKLEVIINPWDNSGSVGRDLRYVDPTEKLSLDCKTESRPKTQIVMDSFNYNTLSYNYQVDNMLNLTVSKKIQLRMDPRLLMYSSLSNGRGEIEKLRDGIYLLKLAVVRNRDYDSKNTYIASAEKFVNVMSGQINTDITLQTQDLKALGNRNNILVEVHPVDESKVTVSATGISLKQAGLPLDSAIDAGAELEVPTFVGPIVLNTDEASRPLRLVDASAVNSFLLNGVGKNDSSVKGLLAQVIKEGTQAKMAFLKEATARSTNTQFAKENNLALVNLNTLPAATPLTKALNIKLNNTRYVVTKEDLQGLLSGRLLPATAQKLCAFWANDFFASQYAEKGGAAMDLLKMGFGTDCFHAVSKDPSRFFHFEKRLAIKEVGETRYKKGFNQGLQVGTNFSYVKSHSASFSKSVSVGAKVGLSKKFLDLFSVGVDVGGSIAWSWTDSSSNSNALNIGTSTTMMVQQSLLNVRVNKYEQCAVVTLSPSLFIKDSAWLSRKDYLMVLNPRLNETELADVVTRGLMVCEGQVRTQPIDISENFYLIAQETSSSQMQDNGDERNRNFFVALRSTNDFNRFVLAIKGETKVPTTADRETNLQHQATNTIEQIFRLGAPSFPGMYLIK